MLQLLVFMLARVCSCDFAADCCTCNEHTLIAWRCVQDVLPATHTREIQRKGGSIQHPFQSDVVHGVLLTGL